MSRSIYKGPFVDHNLMKKLEKGADKMKTYARASMITPDFVGRTIEVHNGKQFVSVHIVADMIGHRLGEFVPTRTFKGHSGDKVAAKGAAKKK